MVDVQRDPEATVIYLLCIVLTAPIIIASLIRGGEIGAGTTICMIIAGAGGIGLSVAWRHRARLPRARVIRSRRRVYQARLPSGSRNR